MSNISVKNKIPFLICAATAVFCAAMLLWYLLFPTGKHEQLVQQAQDRQAQVEETVLQQTETAEKELKELQAEHESVSAQLAEAQEMKTAKEAECTQLQADIDGLSSLPEQVIELRKSYGEKIRVLEDMILSGESDAKICYLTFDDGPNNLTADIIAKLDELDAYATFFTIGANNAPKQTENLRAEMMAGHTIANHTYSHAIDWGLYFSIDNFKEQVLKQDENVYKATGFHMDLFRFPSGSVKCPFMAVAEPWLEEIGYKWVDWNASAWDAGEHGRAFSPAQIAQNIRYTSKDQPITVVLCHDFNYSTYSALDIIVPEYREQGYVFLPLLPQSVMLEEPLPVI